LLALGLVHTTAAFWLFFAGIKNIPARQVGFVMYLDPLTAALLSAVALGEPLTASTLLGGTLILAAGLLALKQPRITRRHNAPPTTDSEGMPTMRVIGPSRHAHGGVPAPSPPTTNSPQ